MIFLILAQAYLNALSTSTTLPRRGADDVLLIREGAEPALFRALFHAWSSAVKGFDPAAAEQLVHARTPRGGASTETLAAHIAARARVFTYAELVRGFSDF